MLYDGLKHILEPIPDIIRDSKLARRISLGAICGVAAFYLLAGSYLAKEAFSSVYKRDQVQLQTGSGAIAFAFKSNDSGSYDKLVMHYPSPITVFTERPLTVSESNLVNKVEAKIESSH